MSLGSDWPTSDLQDVFDEYGLRIIQRDRQRSGTAPWRAFLPLMAGPSMIPMLPGLKPIARSVVMYSARPAASCSAILFKLIRSAGCTESDGVRTVL